jgi:hypothetical protein
MAGDDLSPGPPSLSDRYVPFDTTRRVGMAGDDLSLGPPSLSDRDEGEGWLGLRQRKRTQMTRDTSFGL